MIHLISFLNGNKTPNLGNNSTKEDKKIDPTVSQTQYLVDDIIKNKPISDLIFTEKKCINTRIITELGFFGICSINDFLSMDVIEFGKRYGVGKIMLKYVKSKIDELNN